MTTELFIRGMFSAHVSRSKVVHNIRIKPN